MGLLLIKTEDVYIAVDFLYEPKIKLLVLGEAKTGIVPNSCLEMFFASSLSFFFCQILSNMTHVDQLLSLPVLQMPSHDYE